ncbi:hypothetical protein [Vreelandella sp. H-I2]
MITPAITQPITPVIRSPFGRVVATIAPPLPESAVDPLLAFFSAGDSGLIADPSIDSRRFITTEEITRAAAGDPVGRVVDALSGGPGISQSVAANRPIYSAERGMLIYDGNEDFMDTGVERIGKTGLFASPSEQFCVAIAFIVSPSYEANDSIISRAQGALSERAFLLYLRSTGRARVICRGASTGDADLPLLNTGEDLNVIAINWDGSTLTYRNERGDVRTIGVGTAPEQSGSRIVFGANHNGTDFHFTGRQGAGFIIDRSMSEAEQVSLISELMSRHI